MATAIIYNQYDYDFGLSFKIMEEDFRHLDGLVVNRVGEDETKTDEFFAMRNSLEWQVQETTLEHVRQAVVDGAYLIEIGFLP